MAGVSDPIALVHTKWILFLTRGIRGGFLEQVGLELGFEGLENFQKYARVGMRLDGGGGRFGIEKNKGKVLRFAQRTERRSELLVC